MIAIADGGSTSCDWAFIQPDGTPYSRVKTKGFNPNNIEAENISIEILKSGDVKEVAPKVTHVFYYGAGCGTEDNQKIVREELKKVFKKASVDAQEDLLGAAYAVYQGTPTMVGILGTGSNTCFFDGRQVHVELPSLGFMLGDDGSGNALGKRIVKNFFMKKLPPELHNEFEQDYHLTIEELLEKMYKSDMVNAYFAHFNKFVAKWKTHHFIQNMVHDEFENFIKFQLLPYQEVKDSKVSFVGSIAYFYSDILEDVVNQYNLNFGMIVQKPLDNLVKYHVDFILPKLSIK